MKFLTLATIITTAVAVGTDIQNSGIKKCTKAGEGELKCSATHLSLRTAYNVCLTIRDRGSRILGKRQAAGLPGRKVAPGREVRI
jgi:hypothetical protein